MTTPSERDRLNAKAVHADPLRGSAYAAHVDFCAIFREDMNALYSLSLLLTGNHETAEQCFVAALDDCLLTGKLVFPDWARTWSRRAVIRNAIRLVAPVSSEEVGAAGSMTDALADHLDPSLRALAQLGLFDRFVFVMSVLERYSDPECAALLQCAWREVPRARDRAFQSIAQSGQHPMPMYANASHRKEYFSVVEVA